LSSLRVILVRVTWCLCTAAVCWGCWEDLGWHSGGCWISTGHLHSVMFVLFLYLPRRFHLFVCLFVCLFIR